MKAQFDSAEPTPRSSFDMVEKTLAKPSPSTSSSSPASSVIESSKAPTLVDPSIPNGGLRAWLVVLGSFLIHCFCFLPSEYIFGLFESAYLVEYPGSSHSEIAFVGTLGSSSTYFIGFTAGYLADRLGYRLTTMLGTIIMTVALVLASFTHAIWQLYLTQGIMFGIGASLVYYPAIGAPSHWFSTKCGMAIGIAVSGTGIGGLVGAPAAQALLDNVGYRWTLRILAGATLVACGSASFLISERRSGKDTTNDSAAAVNVAEQGQPSEKVGEEAAQPASFLQQLKVFKNPQFMALTGAELAASFGFLIPMYFYHSYSMFIGLSAETGALITGLASGASCLGRIAIGVAADRLPRTLVVSFCSWIMCLSVLIMWNFSKTFGVYLAFALTFGFFAGGYVSVVPLVVSDTFGAQQLSTVIGFLYAVSGIGMLFGATIAGAILDSTKPNITYLPVIMTAGAMLFIGASCITAWVYFRRKAKKAARAAAH
ncbi:hypothetical protein DFQ26_001835 [Actinomortierella ambigua]|nr:hypothetical protein DFQ26_001835 [Actinomortierella ambigua]